MSQKLTIRLALTGAILFWVLFAGSNIYLLLVNSHDLKVEYSDVLPQVFLSLFIIFTFGYYRFVITKADSLNFTDLLWKVFITGLVTTLMSLCIELFFRIFSQSSVVENPVVINFFYNILIGLVVVYIVSTFVVWKRLILYQRSKKLLKLWSFFELTLLLIIGFDFANLTVINTYFRIALITIGLFSLVLSFNLKWVAYLNFKQKWKSILFILLSGIYLYHFIQNLWNFSSTNVLVIDLFDRVLVLSVFGFLILYALIAILVTLFNLPTSSVFEQKLKEALDFQKLSQSIPSGQTKNQTYETLLDSSMSAVFADAAWLELNDDEGKNQTIRNLSAEQLEQIKKQIPEGPIRDIVDLKFTQERSTAKLSDQLRHSQYRSIIALPIYIQTKQAGYLVLLNEVSDAFNREMVNIITTFVNQASISLENLALIKESIENERYKEQLEIAKNVQKKLLPEELINTSDIEMAAYSMAADEVGGDYYDYIQIDDTKYGVIIGDVSGKGTSAAFHMAQMKGIFHSLASQNIGPACFIRKANQALSKCLERSSFITATYFEIDLASRQLELSRAGHCPALRYRTSDHTVESIQGDGMGLGILRNLNYDKYVSSNTIEFSDGDTFLLYTDGIIEAKNEWNDLYGAERLEQSFLSHASKPPSLIKDGIIKDLSSFIGQIDIDDDYTFLILKFKR